MLGILRSVIDAVLANRLRVRAERDGTPRSTIELCAILQRQGRLASAEKVAKSGLARYPRSMELQDLVQSLWRRTGKKRLAELEKALAQSPSAQAHEALVEFFLEGEELDRAVECAKAYTQAFPKSPTAFKVLGRAHITRFHRDHVAEDGAAALRAYQRAVEADPADASGHFAIAETYYYIGVVSKALLHLYRSMELKPGQPEADKLYKTLVRLPIEKEEEHELLREVEENDEAHFRYAPSSGGETQSVATGLPEQTVREVVRISTLAGVRRVAFSRKGQEVLAQEGQRHLVQAGAKDAFLELAAGFRRTASLSAKRMGIGAFEEAELSWAQGKVVAAASGPTIILVETDPSARLGTIASAARDFISTSQRRGGSGHA